MPSQKSFCVKCFREASGDTKECDCGCKTFAYGDLKVEDGKILCQCGNGSFEQTWHLDYTDKAVTNLKCPKCGNMCGTEYYRSQEEMMMWGEPEHV